MGWKDEYKAKLTSAEGAVSLVKNGDRIVVPLTEQPLSLIAALTDRAETLRGVSVCVSTPGFDIGGLLSGGLEVEVEIFLGPLAREYE
ncbi:MAG: hypothetical protein FI713_02590, partial [SAR202 cluster bacterium]|nr:hypothetical protein [SAR202 cluster bacterium]